MVEVVADTLATGARDGSESLEFSWLHAESIRLNRQTVDRDP
jgi:hypothetical protein